MPRLQFELFIEPGSTRGISSRFTDGKGYSTVSYWSSPPTNLKKEYSLETAATCYLKGRYGNIKTERHAQFIRDEFKRQIAENFIEISRNQFAYLLTEETDTPQTAQDDDRSVRVNQLHMNDGSVAASQGSYFTAMLFRDGDQIGRIGNDGNEFQIALLAPPTLTEMTDILLFCERTHPMFQSHYVKFKIINVIPEEVFTS